MHAGTLRALSASLCLVLSATAIATEAPKKAAAKPAATKTATTKPVAAKSAAKPAADKPAAAKLEAKPAAAKKGGKSTKAKAAPKKEAPVEKEIWTYRSRYAFQGENLELEVAQDNGEWRMFQDESKVIADPLGFEVTLADGSKIGNAQMKLEKSDRGPADDPRIGSGTQYVNVYAPVNGVRLTQRVMKYKERPFLTVRLILENTTAQPVQVARIAPIHVAPGAITGFSPDVEVHTQRVLDRGGFPVRDAAHAPVMTRFHDKGHNFLLLFGVLGDGQGDPVCEFKKDGTAWSGDAATAYAPALTLAAGAAYESDPVCVSFNTPDLKFSDQFYSWALSTALLKATVIEGPTAWATTAPGEGIDSLKEAYNAWSKFGVKHALVRAGTKGKFEKFRDDMGKGVKLGLEIDPLDADGAEGDFVIDGGDDHRWLNISKPEAQEWQKKRVKKLQSADCAFIVVANTTAPAEIIGKMGLTRERALRLAAEAIAAGTDKLFLYGSPATTVDSVAALEPIFGEVAGLVAFGVWPPAVELKTNGNPKELLAAAQKLWPGPVALVGKPN